MFKKDYIMQLIQTLMDAIMRISTNIDTGDFEKANEDLNKSYEWLGGSSDFFKSSNVDEIVSFLNSEDANYSKKTEMLGHLFFMEANMAMGNKDKWELLIKANFFFEYYIEESKEFSFEVNGKITQIMTQLNEINYRYEE